MKISLYVVACLCIVFEATAMAEVTDAGENGFTIVHEALIDASSERVWQAAIDEIGLWWNPDHTVSGDASRLSITAVTQGCFCEDFGAGAGVVHLLVTMVNPGVVIRLTGGLGPLGLMGVSGNMTWELEAQDAGTKITFTYAVGGYQPGGLASIAAPVDDVIGEALQRLKSFVESEQPAQPEIDDLG
jgi:uncharacterized protein YndB with AHSA1/START domain